MDEKRSRGDNTPDGDDPVLQAIKESMEDIDEEIKENQKELEKLEAKEASLIATPQKSNITPTRN